MQVVLEWSSVLVPRVIIDFVVGIELRLALKQAEDRAEESCRARLTSAWWCSLNRHFCCFHCCCWYQWRTTLIFGVHPEHCRGRETLVYCIGVFGHWFETFWSSDYFVVSWIPRMKDVCSISLISWMRERSLFLQTRSNELLRLRESMRIPQFEAAQSDAIFSFLLLPCG